MQVFNREQWFTLPLSLRQRWWKETNYGSSPPLPELKQAIADALKPAPQEAAE